MDAPLSPIDPDSAPLDDRDRRRLARVEDALARGLAVRDWWRARTPDWRRELDRNRLEEVLRAGVHPDAFRLLADAVRTRGATRSYGFFDRLPIDGRDARVQGLALQTFFDRPKLEALERTLAPLGLDPERMTRARARILDGWRDSLRAFVLNYFLRLSSYRSTRAPYLDPDRRPIEPYLRPFSFRPRADDAAGARGLDYARLYYRLRDGGAVGKFRLVDRPRIDLRDLAPGGRFAWIVVELAATSTALELRPPGEGSPFLTVPLADRWLGVVSPELVTREDRPPGENCRGRYGFGYALLDEPGAAEPDFGFEEVTFLVRRKGGILAGAVSVYRRPERLFERARDPFSGWVEIAEGLTPAPLRPLYEPWKALARLVPASGLDPLAAYVRLADAATGGRAAELGISRAELDRAILVEHAVKLTEMLEAARGTWRVVVDWGREEALPGWVRDPR